MIPTKLFRVTTAAYRINITVSLARVYVHHTELYV